VITLKETSEKIKQDSDWWCIHLMNFVDSFRSDQNPQMLAEPFVPSDEKMGALLASAAAYLCDEMEIEIPEWLSQIPACHDPFFVSGSENLKAITIVESPLRFGLRKIFVLENFLSRV
jgi:hypothetical protein